MKSAKNLKPATFLTPSFCLIHVVAKFVSQTSLIFAHIWKVTLSILDVLFFMVFVKMFLNCLKF
jgi:hypothetical protein